MKKMQFLFLGLLSLAVTLTGCGKKEEADETVVSEVSVESSTIAPATATVKGKAILEGIAPTPEKIKMDADPYCKANHADAVVSNEVVVNPDGTLQNVFVYIKEGVQGNYPAPKDPVVFDQTGCMYTPHVFGIQAGQPVKILNSDETLHNVHAMPKNSSQFNLAMPFKGMELTKKFAKPEVMVKIKCDVHPWMSAYAGVLDHPFFAVSGKDGSFQLPTLPPGTYTVEAWHEKYGAQTQQITIGDNETKELSFTFKT